MTGGFSIWGGQWLGHESLWGALSHEMAQAWGYGPDEAAGSSLFEQAATQSQRLGLAALAGLLEQHQVQPGSGLFCGPGHKARRYSSSEATVFRAAARHYGLAGPWLSPVSGVAGGLELLAHAQRSLAKGMPRAICLAAGDGARLTGGDGDTSGAAALGLQAGQGQGTAFLGLVELGTYSGPLDSGTLADFLEEAGRQAKKWGGGPMAAVVMNQPRDVRWQACLDAAARRIAPRARRYALPVDSAGQAGGLMLVMAAAALATPRPESPRLVLAASRDGQAAALWVGAG